MQADDISNVVTGVLRKLKEHGSKPGLVCFDFTGSHALVVGLVQKMLNDRGFLALVALSQQPADGPLPVRMYVDASKRKPKEAQNDAK